MRSDEERAIIKTLYKISNDNKLDALRRRKAAKYAKDLQKGVRHEQVRVQG